MQAREFTLYEGMSTNPIVINLTRISKAEARKRFNNGEIVRLAPNLANLASPWIRGGAAICNKDFTHNATTARLAGAFDTLVNQFQHYNCNAELGRYVAFYKEG